MDDLQYFRRFDGAPKKRARQNQTTQTCSPILPLSFPTCCPLPLASAGTCRVSQRLLELPSAGWSVPPRNPRNGSRGKPPMPRKHRTRRLLTYVLCDSLAQPTQPLTHIRPSTHSFPNTLKSRARAFAESNVGTSNMHSLHWLPCLLDYYYMHRLSSCFGC